MPNKQVLLNFIELANDYKQSLKLLNTRIKEISDTRDLAINNCRRHHNDPEKDPEVIGLKDRLKPLIIMASELQEVTREVRHYYDRRWWRNETLTFNQRKSRSFIYVGPTRY